MVAGTILTSALQPFDVQQALTYAYMSSAAMCSFPGLVDDSSLRAWSCGPACDAVPGMTNVFTVNSTADDAFVYGGKLNGECTIVFRGTSDLAGWMQDLKSATLTPLKGCALKDGTPCQVGSGFLENYKAMSKGLKSNLASIGCAQGPVVVTGHSLGAAEAAIATFDLAQSGYVVSRTYTFGQPRVGDAAFAQYFREAFASVPHFRVTHAADPVVQVPFKDMGFEHVGLEVYYQAGTDKGFKVCDGSGEDHTCSAVHEDEFVEAGLVCALDKSKCAHLTYMTPTKKISMDGDSCTAMRPSLLV